MSDAALDTAPDLDCLLAAAVKIYCSFPCDTPPNGFRPPSASAPDPRGAVEMIWPWGCDGSAVGHMSVGEKGFCPFSLPPPGLQRWGGARVGVWGGGRRGCFQAAAPHVSSLAHTELLIPRCLKPPLHPHHPSTTATTTTSGKAPLPLTALLARSRSPSPNLTLRGVGPTLRELLMAQ